MAIDQNTTIETFGTQTTLTTGTPALIASGGFSVAGDVTAYTLSDDTPEAVLQVTFTYTGTMNSNPSIVLHMRKLNVDGSINAPVPSSDYNGERVGVAAVDRNVAASTNQTVTKRVRLPNAKSGQEYEFYLQNSIGDQISAGWEAKITPVSVKPHP